MCLTVFVGFDVKVHEKVIFYVLRVALNLFMCALAQDLNGFTIAY